MSDINTLFQKLDNYIEKQERGKKNDPWDIQYYDGHGRREAGWEHRHANYNQEKASRGSWHKLDQKHKVEEGHDVWAKFEKSVLYGNVISGAGVKAVNQKYGVEKPTKEEHIRQLSGEGIIDTYVWNINKVPKDFLNIIWNKLSSKDQKGALAWRPKETVDVESVEREKVKIPKTQQDVDVKPSPTEVLKKPDKKVISEEEKEFAETVKYAKEHGLEPPIKEEELKETEKITDWDKYYREQFKRAGYSVEDFEDGTYIFRKNPQGKVISGIFKIYSIKYPDTGDLKYKVTAYDNVTQKTLPIQDEIKTSYSNIKDAFRAISEFIPETIDVKDMPGILKEPELIESIILKPIDINRIFNELTEKFGEQLGIRLRPEDLLSLSDAKSAFYRNIPAEEGEDILAFVRKLIQSENKSEVLQQDGQQREDEVTAEIEKPIKVKTLKEKPPESQEEIINRWQKTFMGKKLDWRAGFVAGDKTQPRWNILGVKPDKPNIQYVVVRNTKDEEPEFKKYTLWKADKKNEDNNIGIDHFDDVNSAFTGLWKYIYPKEKVPIQKSEEENPKTNELFTFLDDYKNMAEEKLPDANIERIFKTLFSQILKNKLLLSSFAAKHNILDRLNIDVEKFHTANNRLDKVIAIDAFTHLGHQNKGLLPIAFGLEEDDIISNRVNNILTQLSLDNETWRMQKQVSNGGPAIAADTFVSTYSGGGTKKKINFFKQ